MKAFICPVHILGVWLARHCRGARPFIHITPGGARAELKSRLTRIGVTDADKYWLHDLRRGHAQYPVDGGGRVKDILAAGEWTSPKFTAYLDIEKMEAEAVVEAHVNESDNEDEDSGPAV